MPTKKELEAELQAKKEAVINFLNKKILPQSFLWSSSSVRLLMKNFGIKETDLNYSNEFIEPSAGRD